MHFARELSIFELIVGVWCQVFFGEGCKPGKIEKQFQAQTLSDQSISRTTESFATGASMYFHDSVACVRRDVELVINAASVRGFSLMMSGHGQ
jgi:hypothetical protein